MVSKGIIIGGAVAGAIAITIGILFSMYISGFNSGQAKDENVRRLAGDIDTQLQRRYDLIPNLVNSVRGYMQFEREVLEQVTQLRTDWQRAYNVIDRVEIANQIEEALSKIILTYEAHPDLKTD